MAHNGSNEYETEEDGTITIINMKKGAKEMI